MNKFDRKRYYQRHPIEARWRNRLYAFVFGHHRRCVVDERLRVEDERVEALRAQRRGV